MFNIDEYLALSLTNKTIESNLDPSRQSCHFHGVMLSIWIEHLFVVLPHLTRHLPYKQLGKLSRE